MSSYSDFANAASDILERKGAAQARATEQGGQIWGSTIANLGQVVPQQVQQVMQQVAQKRKMAQIQTIIQQSGGDLEKALPLINGVDAELGAKFTKEIGEAQKTRYELAKLQHEYETQKTSVLMNKLGSAHDESSWASALYGAHQAGIDVSGYPTEYSPDAVQQVNMELAGAKERLARTTPQAPKEPLVDWIETVDPETGKRIKKAVSRIPGASYEEVTPPDKLVPIPGPEGTPVYGTPVAGQPVYVKPGATGEVKPGSFEDYVLRYAQGKNKTVEQLTTADIEDARKRFQQADDRPRVDVSVNGGAPGNLDKEGLDFAAMDFLLTHRLPARNAGQNGAIISRAAAIGKSIGQSPAVSIQKQAAYAGDSKALQKMQSMSASAEAFESKALAQVDLIKGLSSKVPRTSFPIINAALQSGRTNITGNEDATKLANAIETFSEEYAKVMGGTTGSSAGATDSARAAAKRLINTGMSQGTMTGVLDLMAKEMDLTMQGYGSVISHITDRMGGAASVPAPVTAPGTPPTMTAPTGRVGPYTFTVRP